MDKIKLYIILFFLNRKLQMTNCWKIFNFRIYLSLKVINTYTVIKGIIKET